jgi:hypothetical protein
MIAEHTNKTASEILIECLEDFSTYEPQSVIIIYTDVSEGLNITGNVKRVMALGLLEAGKDLILNPTK